MDEGYTEIEGGGSEKMDNKGNANIYWDQDLKNKRLYLIRYSEIGLKGKST